MSKSQSNRWDKMFREGRENVTDYAHSRQPVTSRGDATVARVGELLIADRRMSVRLLGDTLNILKSVIHRIVTDELQMRKVCAKLFPKVLTEDEKNNRVAVCEELVKCYEGDPNFLDNVITGDL